MTLVRFTQNAMPPESPPITVTLLLKVIEHGDDVHRSQQLVPSA